MVEIDLSGKVALVTGGSRGIGAAITRVMARAGADVTFTHTGDPARTDTVASLLAAIKTDGGTADAAAVDACNPAAARGLVEQIVARRGRLDILVHNVGKNKAREIADVTDEEWERFITINLTSAFIAVRAALPSMLKNRHGRIILIGSSAVADGGGGAADYAAGKAGLTGMMTYLCRTYARRGILTNIIHPCVIETDLLRERYTGDARTKLIGQIPAGRLGKPDDIAGLTAYLASSWGDFICGQSILVDGGRTVYR